MTTLADAAYFAPPYPQVDGWLVYAGGDTPHPVTVAQMAGLPGGYRVPVWARSDPNTNSPTADAAAFLVWLGTNGVPKGVLTVLDMETAVDPAYVNTFGGALHAGGYLVLVYGSKATLFGNPKLDGYFVADYTGVPHIYAGSVITQYTDPGAYDLDDVANATGLWNQGADMPLTPQDIQAIVAAVTPVVDAPIGMLQYGDSEAAAQGKVPQGHPFNLYNMTQQLAALQAAVAALEKAVAALPTTSLPVTLTGTNATAHIAFE